MPNFLASMATAATVDLTLRADSNGALRLFTVCIVPLPRCSTLLIDADSQGRDV